MYPQIGDPQSGDNQIRNVKLICMVIFLLIAICSVTFIGGWASSADSQSAVISALDRKKMTVLELTAATTATSVAISLLPGDAASPVADQLAELSNYFLLILCAIYLEKYLVTIMGFVTFRLVIPVAMGFLIYFIWKDSELAKRIGIKLAVFGLVLFFVIPASVLTTNLIEKTYGSSITETLQAAENAVNEIREGQDKQDTTRNTDTLPQSPDDSGWIDKIRDLPGNLKETAENVVSGITTLSAEMIVRLKTILNHFIEAVAVMIITSCVIPVLVLVIFVYTAKVLLSGFFPDSKNA